MKSAANQKEQQEQINYDIFNDLTSSEKRLFEGCMTRIMRHVDKNIERAKEPASATRMLTVRWLIHKNLQKADN